MPAAAVAPGARCFASARPLGVAKPCTRTNAAAPVTSRVWRVLSEIPHNPCAVATPQVLGFTVCGTTRAVMPRARKFAASTAIEPQRSWRVPSTVVHQTEVAVARGARGFTTCERIAIAAPQACDQEASPTGAIERHSIEPAPQSLLMGSWRFALVSPALRSGSALATKKLLHKLIPIPPRKAGCRSSGKLRSG